VSECRWYLYLCIIFFVDDRIIRVDLLCGGKMTYADQIYRNAEMFDGRVRGCLPCT
jgi:hypothetical protein